MRVRLEKIISGGQTGADQGALDGAIACGISHGPLTGGSALTERLALQLGKPCLHIDFSRLSMDQACRRAADWAEHSGIKVLNVAGPRASSDPTIYARTRELIILLLDSAGEQSS
jgi:hypothetical protein